MHTVEHDFHKKNPLFCSIFLHKKPFGNTVWKKIGDSFFFQKLKKSDRYFLSVWTKVNRNLGPLFWWIFRITTETTILKTNYRLVIFRKPSFFKKSFCKIEICSKTKMLQEYIARYLVPSKLDTFFKISK